MEGRPARGPRPDQGDDAGQAQGAGRPARRSCGRCGRPPSSCASPARCRRRSPTRPGDVRAVVLAGAGAVAVADVPAPVLERSRRRDRPRDDGGDLRVGPALRRTDARPVAGRRAGPRGRRRRRRRWATTVTRVSAGDRVVLSYVNAVRRVLVVRAAGRARSATRSRVFGAGAFGGDLAGAQAERRAGAGRRREPAARPRRDRRRPCGVPRRRAPDRDRRRPSLAAPGAGETVAVDRRRPRRAARDAGPPRRPAPGASWSSTASRRGSPWPSAAGAIAIDVRASATRRWRSPSSPTTAAPTPWSRPSARSTRSTRRSTWSAAAGASSSPACTPAR